MSRVTKLYNEFCKADHALTLIEGLAAAIDAESRNTPNSRHQARHISRKVEELREQLRDVFKVGKNDHLGAVSEEVRNGHD